MKNKKIILLFLLLSTVICIFTGCTGEDKNLIAEFSASPNEDYVKDEKDIVHYNIKIYQKDEKNIIVEAKSNLGFFDDIQKEIEVGGKITKDDIDLRWKNLMGKEDFSRKNQIAIAEISINTEKENIRFKINFVKNAINMIG